jgi:hypothetical protein
MKITWADFWALCRDYILPESGTLVWNLVLYGILGLVVAIGLLALGQKYGLFTRNYKYYNWGVKLYIPLILLGTLYFSLQLGLFRGIYRVMDDQTELMAEGIYGQTVDRLVETPAEKEAYLVTMKATVVLYHGATNAFVDTLKQEILNRDSGYGLVDDVKDGLTSWLIDRYGDDIFSAIVATVLEEAAKKAGADVHLAWDDPSHWIAAMEQLDLALVEAKIHDALAGFIHHIFESQFRSARTSTLLLWFGITLLFPLVEWAVYHYWLRNWIERRLARE